MSTQKKRAGRSPSYPDIELQEAIEKARRLWVGEHRNFAPLAAIQQHWGYKANTGPGLRAVSALLKFGLLADRGRGENRQAKLTVLAIKIILDDRPNSPDRDDAIREAALNPPIHRELWERYQGDLPSDATLRYTLLTERGFSEAGADALIREFKSTVEFAKLAESDIMADKPSGEGEEDRDKDQEHPDIFNIPFPPSERDQTMQTTQERPKVGETSSQPEKRVIQVPLPTGEWVAIQLPVPLTETDWDQMFNVLNAMKPGLVQSSGRQEQA